MFRRFSGAASTAMGSAWAFIVALLIIGVWAITGPMFDFSDTWQLVINTGTTIITFIMVFLIQNTQNRDAKVIHLKLDELLRALKPARTQFAELEHLSDEELERYEQEFLDICLRERQRRGHKMTVRRHQAHKHTGDADAPDAHAADDGAADIMGKRP
jgi:low affinity Fe/Cu permease